MTAKIKRLKRPRTIELYVELEPTEPRVWRRILIDDSVSMYQLHEILQVTMGWMHSHVFMFRAKGLVITEPNPEDVWGDVKSLDARKTKVASVFKNPGDSIIYEYDFGDSWTHNLRFEQVVSKDAVMFEVPRCIGGENACPPEDCGSFPGFERLKEIISNPEDDEYEGMIRWLDGYYPNYNPREFSLSSVNKILKIGASRYLRLVPKFYE
jgi:hypothetical protein